MYTSVSSYSKYSSFRNGLSWLFFEVRVGKIGVPSLSGICLRVPLLQSPVISLNHVSCGHLFCPPSPAPSYPVWLTVVNLSGVYISSSLLQISLIQQIPVQLLRPLFLRLCRRSHYTLIVSFMNYTICPRTAILDMGVCFNAYPPTTTVQSGRVFHFVLPYRGFYYLSIQANVHCFAPLLYLCKFSLFLALLSVSSAYVSLFSHIFIHVVLLMFRIISSL